MRKSVHFYNHPHPYDPEIVDKILNDPEYYILFFTQLAALRNEKKFIPKKRANGDYTMLCPIHKEKSPSFRVHGTKFKCFGCGHSGNILLLIQKVKDVSFRKAIGVVLEFKQPALSISPNQITLAFPKS